MTPSRFTKALQRRMVVSWRAQASQSDIEALEANVERVGLVVRIRWAIVAAIAIFSIISIAIYAADDKVGVLFPRMIVPGTALMLVLVYNAFYQMTYRRYGNLAAFNVAQLLLDIGVVTVLVFYSGGVYSWFDAMYYLFVLEAALILPTRKQVWLVAGIAAACYLAVLTLVVAGLLPHMAMPFVDNSLQREASYVAVRALWTVTVILGTASVGVLFMGSVEDRLGRMHDLAVRDSRTGLYDRAYLRRELSVEIERGRRFRRGVSVVLADIDDFAHFNGVFGVEAGNRMIDRVAEVVRAVSGFDAAEPSLIVAARYGGEEFALLIPEGDSQDTEADLVAERLRAGIAAILDEDRSVTVSVGVARYPRDGRTATDLLSVADAALSSVAAEGGNRVTSGRPVESQ